MEMKCVKCVEIIEKDQPYGIFTIKRGDAQVDIHIHFLCAMEFLQGPLSQYVMKFAPDIVGKLLRGT
jgi:hypothetical protein